jgi:hypothetical protein
VSYSELAGLVTFRPISNWPGGRTDAPGWSRFKAPWSQTVDLLARELWMLDAERAVLEIAIEERDLRLDGLPRANARATDPGVILSFDSKFGPLRYAVDTYHDWQDNVRAIALAMEALRKVDRYGVTKRGEQYTGWRAIPASTGNGIYTRDQAEAFVDEYGGSFTAAAKNLHPDRGGSEDAFSRLVAARELLAPDDPRRN